MAMTNPEIRNRLQGLESRASLPQLVDTTKLQTLNVKYLEIHRGCGSRICRICHVNSPKNSSRNTSIPFEVIKKVHRHAYVPGGEDFDGQISHFYRGEATEWREGNRTYADVVADAVQAGWVVRWRTHGRIQGDTDTTHVIEQLKQLWKQDQRFQTNFIPEFSIDPYGWVGIDLADYESAVRENLYDLVEPFFPDIFAYFNPSDTESGPGSKQTLADMLTRVLPPAYQAAYDSKVTFNELRTIGGDRASQIVPEPPASFMLVPWHGDLITYDGEVMAAGGRDLMSRGSIYIGMKGTVNWNDSML